MFGYVAMPSNASRLKDCVSLNGYSRQHPHARITVSLPYDLKKGTLVDPFDYPLCQGSCRFLLS
jgi:hypothetical protein